MINDKSILGCVRCHKFYPISAFHVDNRRTRGYQTWCKACKKTYRAEVNKNAR